ncbi:hypothetical protein XA68_18218 [Ophiocordyceps unilateralis]|uniref:Uncharacterized protein n=1 Tax=Ophiocordyceps unilateralis TaxID=268505 RepID=A0A2A9PQ97_OPHUN|nr:hypothetical protein XA68_18218 [Ophiocordyceps unilateralis]
MTIHEPPTYEEGEPPCGQLPGSGNYTLILDGCDIYPSEPPSPFLYKLSSPVCQAAAQVYRLDKFRYRFSQTDGEGRLISRPDEIYEFQTKYTYSFKKLRSPVIIEGKTSRSRTNRCVMLEPSVTGWSSCSAEGHFKAKMSLWNQVTKGSRILWEDMAGVVVAIETRPGKKEVKKPEPLPRLEIKESLGERELDLLVACWAARLWKEAERDERPPMTWEGAKRTLRRKDNWFGSTALL